MIVVFDLDGTLADTSEGILGAIGDACSALGLPPLPDAERDAAIGPPIRETFARVWGLGEARSREAAEAFREAYADPARLAQAKLYPGIAGMLRALRSEGLGLAVATNKRVDCAEAVLGNLGIREVFSTVAGSTPGTFESKSQILARCLAGAGEDAGGAAMVGDSPADMAAASDAGVPFVAVTWGFGFAPGAPPPADHVARSVEELCELLLRI